MTGNPAAAFTESSPLTCPLSLASLSVADDARSSIVFASAGGVTETYDSGTGPYEISVASSSSAGD